MLGREHDLEGWPVGVWSACETSHTQAAQQVMQARFKKKGIKCVFGPCVEKHTNNAGIYRGKAAGTAIFSKMPLVPYPEQPDAEVLRICRFNDALVRVNSFTQIYIAAIYGPPESNVTYTDGDKIFNVAAAPALRRATAYKGPAAITGDFNRDLDKCGWWDSLRRLGWHDAALLANERFGQPLSPTCKNRTRKSFILVNDFLASRLMACQTTAHHLYDAHPVLEAVFDMEVEDVQQQVWTLPKSLDDYIFDPNMLQQFACEQYDKHAENFHEYLQDGDTERAFRIFHTCFEETFKHAAVDVEGNSCSIDIACWKRGQKKLNKKRSMQTPIIKSARQGDLQVDICQGTVSLRKHVKQGRRLQSIICQLHAYNREMNDTAGRQCIQLWNKILSASGFSKGFQTWSLLTLRIFVPDAIPTVEAIQQLYDAFRLVLDEEVKQEKAAINRICRKRIKNDVMSGGANAFRSLKDQQPPPLTYLQYEKKQFLRRQRWKKEGNTCLLLEGECTLVAGLPILFQNQKAIVLEIDQQHLLLDRPVKCKDHNDLVVVQAGTTADNNQLQLLVREVWEPLWNNDPDGKIHDTVQDAISQLNIEQHCGYKDFNLDDWRYILKRANKHAARGACGYSVYEMQCMPEVLIQMLFQFFSAIENGARWPLRCTTARVTMLAKPNEQLHCPKSVRPITILSVVYRLYSSFRSMHVLKYLGQLVPAQVAGIAARLSADMMAAFVSDQIDHGYDQGILHCGLVVDLQKCFNLIPRKVIAVLMRKLGLPEKYISGQQMMLKELIRYIEISGQTGDLVPSNCGFPEGCAMSVAAMAALTILAANEMCQTPTTQVSMYADNWGVMCRCIADLRLSIEKLEALVEALSMRISTNKSWLWGTSSAYRKQLKDVRLCNEVVPIKLAAKDLGCDISYGRGVRKATAKARLAKSKRMLGRLRRKQLPKSFKAKATTCTGTGVVGYGSELQYFTNDECGQLRSAVAAALGFDKSGSNALLSLNTTGEYIDPQVRLLRRKIRFYRRFFTVFPERKQPFLSRIAKLRSATRAGLARNFRKAFELAGWNCENDGLIKHVTGIQFNWIRDSLKYIYKCLDKAWNHEVCTRIERQFFDIDHFSGEEFFKCIQHRSSRHKALLANIASGKHVTKNALSKYSKKIPDDTCPFCTCKDGKFHRVFECVGLQPLRTKHRHAVNWAKRQPEAIWAFGLAPDDCRAVLRRQRMQIHYALRVPNSADRVRVYTDGSSFFNQDWQCCVAGAAAIVATGEYHYHTCFRELLPYAHHNAFRAESHAVLGVLNRFRKCDIFTDCAAVFQLVVELLECKRMNRQPDTFTHPDIWDGIWWHISQRAIDDVVIQKIQAHLEWKTMEEGQARMHAFFSDKVDQQAKQAVTCDHATLFQQMQRLHDHRVQVRRQLTAYHDFLCEMHDLYFQQTPAQQPTSDKPDFVMLQHVSGHKTVHMPKVDINAVECPFGVDFCRMFAEWWNKLEWGSGQFTSCLELYFSFAISTRTMVPVRMGPKQYLLRSQSVAADVTSCDLATQSHTWINMIKWWLQLVENGPTLSKGRGLHPYGYTFEVKGFGNRPVMPCGEAASESLWSYFHSHDEGSRARVRRDFKAHWHVHMSPMHHAQGGA